MYRCRILLLFIVFIVVIFVGCATEPVPRETTPVEEREESIMVQKETVTIETNRDLLNAAFEGDVPELTTILEAHENDVAGMKEAQTALMLASVRGHTESVRVLLDAGVDVNGRTVRGGTALMWAAGSSVNSTETVRMLLEAGADVNAKTEDGRTALMDAVLHGNTGTVQLLLGAGANVNVQSVDGTTPLTAAKGAGHYEIQRLLEGAGAVDMTR